MEAIKKAQQKALLLVLDEGEDGTRSGRDEIEKSKARGYCQCPQCGYEGPSEEFDAGPREAVENDR